MSERQTQQGALAGAAMYRTIATPGYDEIIVERSRFVGWAEPVESEEAALARVEALRRAHHDARHVCFGARIGRAPRVTDRFSDDGEPTRTGGFPMLQLLQGEELVDVLIVSVRYFGGIKLGTGGLARAYRECARRALAAAVVEERWPEGLLTVSFPYHMVGSIDHALVDEHAARVLDRAWAADVTYQLAVRVADVGRVRRRLATLLQCHEEALSWDASGSVL